MDETAIAFELPHARASATHAGPPLDRISVRDYVRQVEIGAFRTERGVTQRIRFNVVLEVSHHAAAQDDDVDKVISYDTITEAIEHALAVERVNLLETLAERVAAGCLADRRAVRAFVRIEKLDRIPGALGVEIVRTRLPDEAPRLRPVGAARGRRPPASAARRLPRAGAGAAGGRLARRARRLGPPGRPLPRAAPAAVPPAATEAQRRIGLLAIEQAAWAFADARPALRRRRDPHRARLGAEVRPPLGLGARRTWWRPRSAPGARRQRPGRRSPPGSPRRSAPRSLVVAGAAPPRRRRPAASVAVAGPEDLATLRIGGSA